MNMSEYIVEMKHITKRFPGIVANDDVTIQIKKGEIFALLGENGAGKSTFIKICTGQITPDSGQIFRHPAASFGCLDQYAQMKENITISDFLKSAFQSLFIKEEQMNLLYSKAAAGDEKASLPPHGSRNN